jgi:hypothetical protein
MTALLNLLIPLSAILIYILVGVFFCLSQRSAIRVVQRKNRQLAPDLVWLQLIPILRAICNIVVTILIATGFQIIHWIKLNRIKRKIAGLTN